MSNLSFNKLYEWSLGLMVFLMIVTPSLIAIGILLFFAISALGIVKKYLKFHLNKLGVLFILLYLSYFVGSFYTNNTDIANKYLEYKLTFLLIPFLFSLKSKDLITIRIPASILIVGVLLVTVLGFFNGISLFMESNNINFLFSSQFSYIHHPTYLSVFAIFASALLIYGHQQQWKGYSLLNVYLGFIVFLLVQVFCLSLAGILFSLGYVFVIGLLWSRKKLSQKLFYSFVLCGLISIIALVKYTPDVNAQFINSVNYLTEYWDDPEEFFRSKQTNVGGSETRLIMWAASCQVFVEHPFGVGTGNVDDFLSDKLNEIGQPHMAAKNLNPHNQFLQTAVEVGVFGLALLIFLAIYGTYVSIQTKNWLLLFVIISLAFNCLFESMLQRQSGIVFYTFWICLLPICFPEITKTAKVS